MLNSLFPYENENRYSAKGMAQALDTYVLLFREGQFNTGSILLHFTVLTGIEYHFSLAILIGKLLIVVSRGIKWRPRFVFLPPEYGGGSLVEL